MTIKDPVSLSVGVVGFGEVAGMLSTQLVSCGVPVYVYDVNQRRKGGMAKLKKRDGADLVSFLSIEEVAARSDILISTVPPGEALAAAREAISHLCSDTFYVDLASVGSQTKREIDGLMVGAGLRFVEGVILEAVSIARTRARILLCGPYAGELALTLRSWGLNAEDFGTEIGRASNLKMVRSIVMKGIEAILVEALTTARRKNLDHDLWATLSDVFDRYGFEKIALTLILSHCAAARRRYAEMSDVVDTIREAGIKPIVSDGVLELFRRSAELAQTGALSNQVACADAPEALMRQLELVFEDFQRKDSAAMLVVRRNSTAGEGEVEPLTGPGMASEAIARSRPAKGPSCRRGQLPAPSLPKM